MPGNRDNYADRPRPHARDRNMVVHYAIKEGFSQTQLAQKLGVKRTTMRRWARRCPKFKEALALATTHAQAYWEHIGDRNLTNAKFNAQIYLKILSCRFRRDYGHRAVVTGDEFEGTPAQPITKVKRVIVTQRKHHG